MFVVTGGAGFIGSNLLAALEARREAPLVVCDRLRSNDKWRNIAKRELSDIVHPDKLFAFLDAHADRVNTIFHMGAVSSTAETDGDLIVDTNFNLTVALFAWYWDRTLDARSWKQWLLLGAIAGLMINVYYPNAILLILPGGESVAALVKNWRAGGRAQLDLAAKNVLFVLATVIAFLPTLIAKKIIYGSYFYSGYYERWFWNSPALLKVCFSANHGLFSWTPILLLSVVGMFLLMRANRVLGWSSIAVFATYLYAIGCYENWQGLSSFGNRFFISLTALFVLGLTAFFDWLGRVAEEKRASAMAWGGTCLLIAWNLGLIFQWGTHLIPARGPIVWREAAYNQFVVVPVQAGQSLKAYFARRQQMMGHIEEEDVNQLKSQPSEGTK